MNRNFFKKFSKSEDLYFNVFDNFLTTHVSRDSAVAIATGYGLVHTSSGAHPTSYPMGTGGSFPGGKAAMA
jgi:hypothetical protein